MLELSKTLLYEFWYDYGKPKYSEKAILCYMDTGSFIVYIKTDDIYKNMAEDVETRFDTWVYELDRTLPKGKNKKNAIGLMKDELDRKIMIKFVALWPKTYSYLINGDSENDTKTINFDDVIKENIKEDNANWPEIPDHPCRIMIIGVFRSEKRNSLFNLISQQPDIDKIYFYAKYPYQAKHQFLISKRESTDLKQFHDFEAFIEYSNGMADFYKKKWRIQFKYEPSNINHFWWYDADILGKKSLNPIATESYIKDRKSNIFLVLITQPYFAVPKNIRLRSTHYFFMKILKKQQP